jgi:NAD(P)H-dependent FMN reductase
MGNRAAHLVMDGQSARGHKAVLVVSGEYNHGIPPALKDLLDHFPEEHVGRRSGIACSSVGAFEAAGTPDQGARRETRR